MHMPHFGCIEKVNVHVKQLLLCFHGGCLWLIHKTLVDVKLVLLIIGLPLAGVNPTPFFARKDTNTMLTNKLKEKYDMKRDMIGFTISSINEIIVRLTAKGLSSKLLRMMWLNQCTAWTIAAIEQCAVGIQLNWSHYLLNEMLTDVKEV